VVKRWLVLCALWAIPGVIQAVSLYSVYTIKGDDSLSLLGALAWRVPEWQVWALATPLILYAARRWPITRTPWKSVPVHLVLATVVAFADITVYYWLGYALDDRWIVESGYLQLVSILMLKTAYSQLVIYAAVLVADQALAYQRRYREAALAKAQLEVRLVEAQLDALKQQLHPHFLFNTINAITVLMRKGESGSAIRMLGGLSDLLRRSLSSLRVERVTFAEELDFIERYLEIQTMRFPDRLRVTMEIADAARGASFPSMLLQPIVENAIEHGIAPRVGGGRITIAARVVDGKLRVEVRDDGVGLDSPATHGHGVGLSNVRKRLAQLYPETHVFRLEPANPGCLAVLELPYEELPCAP
jgi:two-component system, LytTR family, sensor kinase